MRFLSLAVAVLAAVSYASKNAAQKKDECQPLDKGSAKGTLTYSADKQDEKYPNGTNVTLTCSSDGPVVGEPVSTCINGKWKPKLGHCGAECSQAFARDLGYSGMLIDGEPKNGNAPHHSNVEFICEKERHKYQCYDGTFLPKHTFEPCGTCSTAKVARLGYAGMNVHGHTLNGNLVEGSVVSLQCHDELHWFSCTSGELQPHDESQSICVCAPPSKTAKGQDRYVFSTSLKDGFYERGTKVALFCNSGPVVGGSSSSTCIGGDWYPPLGRCPEMCDKKDLTKKQCENPTLSEPAAEETDLQYHGGKASATCTVNSTSTPLNMTCIDGDWCLRRTI